MKNLLTDEEVKRFCGLPETFKLNPKEVADNAYRILFWVKENNGLADAGTVALLLEWTANELRIDKALLHHSFVNKKPLGLLWLYKSTPLLKHSGKSQRK